MHASCFGWSSSSCSRDSVICSTRGGTHVAGGFVSSRDVSTAAGQREELNAPALDTREEASSRRLFSKTSREMRTCTRLDGWWGWLYALRARGSCVSECTLGEAYGRSERTQNSRRPVYLRKREREAEASHEEENAHCRHEDRGGSAQRAIEIKQKKEDKNDRVVSRKRSVSPPDKKYAAQLKEEGKRTQTLSSSVSCKTEEEQHVEGKGEASTTRRLGPEVLHGGVNVHIHVNIRMPKYT